MPITRTVTGVSDDGYNPLNQGNSTVTEIDTSKTIKDTSKEVRPDKLTEAEINAIENPSKGQEVHDTTNNVNKFWNGSTWVDYGADSLYTFGFIDYNDTTGAISLTAETWTDVPNNGLGAFTNTAYKPEGVTNVIDTSTGYLDFSELTLGSEIFIRNDFKVSPNTNNALLQVRYLLGQGVGEYPLLFWSERLDNGSGIDYQRVPLFGIYMGDLNTQGGVGKLQVKLSTNGTFTNAGSYISIKLK
jgi:hypothetical protein